MCCNRVAINNRTYIIPTFLPITGWSINSKGYLIYTSRRRNSPIKRGDTLQRVVVKHLAALRDIKLPDEYHVHHQDSNKLNCCPFNLVVLPLCLNPVPVKRDPYTGHFLNHTQYERRYGSTNTSNYPDWVTENPEDTEEATLDATPTGDYPPQLTTSLQPLHTMGTDHW